MEKSVRSEPPPWIPPSKRQRKNKNGVPMTPRVPIAEQIPDDEELNKRKAKAVMEEEMKKEKKRLEEEKKNEKECLELGKKLKNLKLCDLPTHDTIRGRIAVRGEDFVSNVRDGVAYLKEQLGSSAKGTIFNDICGLTGKLIGIPSSSVAERKERLLDPAAARRGFKQRRITRKELRKRAALKLSPDDKKSLFAYLQDCWTCEKNVTLDSILEWAKKNIDFEYGKTVLAYALGGMGLCFRMKNHNPTIEERKDLITLREIYLRKLNDYRNQDVIFAFFDETWVYAGMVTNKAWQMRTSTKYMLARLAEPEQPLPGPKKGATRGKRGITVAVLTPFGVLPGSEEVWVSGGKLEDQVEDYHREMTAALYEDYMKTKVIPGLEKLAADKGKKVVMVIDNAPYHNRCTDKAPTKSDRKSVLQDFLTTHGVDYDRKETNAKLYKKVEELLEKNGGRSQFKKYVMDEYARTKGIDMLRLPPYHCFLSPIELLWAQVKRGVMKLSTTETKLCEIRRLTLNSLRSFTEEQSIKLYQHVEKFESELREKIQQKKERVAAEEKEKRERAAAEKELEMVEQLDENGDWSQEMEQLLENSENFDDQAYDEEDEDEALEELARAAADYRAQEELEETVEIDDRELNIEWLGGDD